MVRVERTEKAQEIIQLVAQAVQQSAHERVSGVVSRCLATVFPDPYEFKIHFERKRGKTEARPVLLRAGREVSPLDGVGGGILDVTAFALRVVYVAATVPKVRPLLVMDEPFKNLSRAYQDSAAKMVETLATEFGIQFVVVTHADAFRIGKVIEIS